MDRDKLIEKMNKVKSLLEASENPNTYKYEAWMSLEEVNLILTSLTAPVPDGITSNELGDFVEWVRQSDFLQYKEGWCQAGGLDGWHCTTYELIEMFRNLTKTPDLPDGKAIIKGRSPYEAYKLFIEQAENEIRELGLDLTEDIIMVYALKHCEEYIRHFEKAKQLIYSGGQINKK